VVKKGFFPKIGFGNNLSPALFIDDLIPPLIAAGKKETLKHGLYIIASEESYPLVRIVKIIARCIDKKVRFIYIPKWCALFGATILEVLCKVAGKNPPVTYRNIKSTITDRTFSINRAVNDLDFKQSITIDSGMEKTIKYFRDEKLI
jgi:nucleoside-diphosphate-sugar epimerase